MLVSIIVHLFAYLEDQLALLHWHPTEIGLLNSYFQTLLCNFIQVNWAISSSYLRLVLCNLGKWQETTKTTAIRRILWNILQGDFKIRQLKDQWSPIMIQHFSCLSSLQDWSEQLLALETTIQKFCGSISITRTILRIELASSLQTFAVTISGVIFSLLLYEMLG